MTREAFKERMKSLKSYRELNPDKGYWDWKVQALLPGGVTDGPPTEVIGPPTEKDALKESLDILEAALKLATKDLRKRLSGRDRYERAAHHISSGDWANLASYIWDSNKENVPYYTGSIISGFDKSIDYPGDPIIIQGNETNGVKGISSAPNTNRDLVTNFIYGDDVGFKKSTKKPLTVNGKTYEERQYEGTIAPIDTIFLPKSMVPTIDSLIAEKSIYAMDHNGGYTPSYYREDRLKNYTYDNVANHSGVFRKNKKGEYSTELFDLWDFLGDYDYSWNWLAHKFQEDLKPDEFFPNAGPFILRQEVPIKFVEDSVLNETRRSGKYFLDRLDTSSNAASKILKPHVLKWNNSYAEGGEVTGPPIEEQWWLEHGNDNLKLSLLIAKNALSQEMRNLYPENFKKKYKQFNIGEENYNKLKQLKAGVDTTQLKNIDYTLQEYGFNKKQRAAYLGNALVESEIQYDRTQDGGGGGEGFLQVTDKSRKKAQEDYKYSKDWHYYPTTLDYPGIEQIRWFNLVYLDELQGKHHKDEWGRGHKSTWKTNFKNFSSPSSNLYKVVDGLLDGYVRPGKPHTSQRQKGAKIIYDFLPGLQNGGQIQSYKDGGKTDDVIPFKLSEEQKENQLNNAIKDSVDRGNYKTAYDLASRTKWAKENAKEESRFKLSDWFGEEDVPIWGTAVSAVKAGKSLINQDWDNFALSVLNLADPLGAVTTKKPIKSAIRKKASKLNWKDWGLSKKHLDEYLDIEEKARKNGTWLKNPDGTDFTGDPREWVARQSKNFKKAFGDDYRVGYTGMREGYNPKDLRTSYIGSKDRAYTYTLNNKVVRKEGDTGVAKIVTPNTNNEYVVDATGNDWLHLTDKTINPYTFVNTNQIVDQILTPIISFKNIRDDGPFGYRDVIEDQFVIKNGYPRKSILYNNGDFDLNNPNIFKFGANPITLSPYAMMLAAEQWLNQNNKSN